MFKPTKGKVTRVKKVDREVVERLTPQKKNPQKKNSQKKNPQKKNPQKKNLQKKNLQRVKKVDRKPVERLNYDGVSFPVEKKDYNRVETQNNIRVNVLGYENKRVFPLYLSKEKYERELDLLLIEKDGVKHYVLIKDFDRLMFNKNKHKGKKFFCKYCLQNFYTKERRETHKKDCMVVNGTQAVRMPREKNKWMKFENHSNQLPVPFVIYVDLESVLKPLATGSRFEAQEPVLERDHEKRGKTTLHQIHKACGYGLKLVCNIDDEFSEPVEVYRGKDAVKKLLYRLLELEKEIKRIRIKNFNKPIVMSERDELAFNTAINCHICGKECEEDDRVRDHCHLTGKFRGLAHKKCNLNFQPT